VLSGILVVFNTTIRFFPVSLSACRVGRAQEVIDDALFSLHLLVTDDASIEDFVCLGGLQVNTLTGMKRIN